MARQVHICPDCGGVEGASCWSDESCYRNQARIHAATLTEIRAILAEPVREIVEESFPTPWQFQDLRLHHKQWKRLHELLGGDHG